LFWEVYILNNGEIVQTMGLKNASPGEAKRTSAKKEKTAIEKCNSE
jgi:hypothetical protein